MKQYHNIICYIIVNNYHNYTKYSYTTTTIKWLNAIHAQNKKHRNFYIYRYQASQNCDN